MRSWRERVIFPTAKNRTVRTITFPGKEEGALKYLTAGILDIIPFLLSPGPAPRSKERWKGLIRNGSDLYWPMTFVELWPLAGDWRRHFFLKQVRELSAGLKEHVRVYECAQIGRILKRQWGNLEELGKKRKTVMHFFLLKRKMEVLLLFKLQKVMFS